MKNYFKSYLIIWVIILVVFNTVAFISAGVILHDGFTISFWIGYGFITVAFIGQLVCANVALKADSIKKRFLTIPLFTISYIGLGLMLAVGLICMLVSVIPCWVCILLSISILSFTAVSVSQANVASDIITGVEEGVKANNLFIKSLTVDACTVMESAKSEVIKEVCNRVYEAIRYSDPMSADVLSGVESQITLKFNEFSESVKTDNTENAKRLADELIVFIGDRNKKCKLLK